MLKLLQCLFQAVTATPKNINALHICTYKCHVISEIYKIEMLFTKKMYIKWKLNDYTICIFTIINIIIIIGIYLIIIARIQLNVIFN